MKPQPKKEKESPREDKTRGDRREDKRKKK
jgi:hypothetical protein